MASLYSEDLEEPFYCNGLEWNVLEIRVEGHDGPVKEGIKLYKRACVYEVQEMRQQMFRAFVMFFPHGAFLDGDLRLGDDHGLGVLTRRWVNKFLTIHTEPVGWSFADRPLPVIYCSEMRDGYFYEPRYIYA